MTLSIPILVAASLGAYLAASARGAATLFGASPDHLLLPAATLLSVFALFSVLPTNLPPARRRHLLLFLPPLLLLLADPLLALAARLPLLPEQLTALSAAVWLLVGLPTLRRAAAGLHAAPPPLLLAAAALGLGAVLLPGWLGALLAAALLLAATLLDRRPPRDVFALGGLPDSVPVLLATAALGLLWLSLRAALSPTLAGALLVSVGALLGGAAGRLLAIPPLWPRLVLSGGAVLGVWASWGILWVQAQPLSAAPTALRLALLGAGALGGVLLGVSWGRRPAPLAWLGVAGGLALVAGLDWGPLAAPGLLIVLSAAAILLGARPGTRAAGGILLVGAAVVVFLERSPVAALAAEGRFTQHRTADGIARSAEARAGMREASAAWGGRGVLAVRAPEEMWTPQRPDRLRRLQVEQDGLVTAAPSRADSADALAGHLAGALAPERGDIVVLGDDLGTALGAVLRYNPGRVRSAVPFPEVPRAIAPLDPERERVWLDPAVQLEPVHPEALLRLTPSADAIVSIVRAPWADSARPLLGPDHIRAMARRLGDSGVAVLGLHLLWMGPDQPEAVVAQVAAAFAHVQLWMPPSGADTMLVVASQQPLSLPRLLARAEGALPGLQALSLRSPAALAGLAISDRAQALAWSDGARASVWDGLRLPGVVWQRPIQHLGGLAAHTAPPAALWGPLEADLEADLLTRQASQRQLLQLFGSAASGNIEDVMAITRGLREETLDPLIDPHMRDAREELAAAIAEGPDSPRWEAALRYATTAQMLSPSSPRPYLAIGDILLRQREIDQARVQFERALERDAGNLSALTALARIAQMKGDRVTEEQLLRQAVTQNARDWQAHQNLGAMLLFVGRYDEAELALREAASLSQGAAERPLLALTEIYLSTDQPARALVEAERATQVGGSAQSWFLRGRAHYALEQLDLAAEDYQRAVLADPSHALARAAYGHVRYTQGRLEEAAEALRQSLQLRPDNDAARELLRRIQRELRAQEALAPN